MNPNDENKVIEPGKPNEVSKSPWECKVSKGLRKPKESKWAKDAQEKNKRDTGAYKRRPLPCAKGEEQQQKKRKARITVTTI